MAPGQGQTLSAKVHVLMMNITVSHHTILSNKETVKVVLTQ